ncbi:MAG: Trk system potassium transporter TrkA [Clostridia bacterium]
MEIIICGCGKVGAAIAEQLARENHDITVIDSDREVLEKTVSTLDVIGICGDGASKSVLTEAGARTCDLIIAITYSDEVNLLICLIAKKLGTANTIARIRNPVYSESIPLIKDDLRLSLAINPELAAAEEISRLIRFPSAMKIDTFAKGTVELLKHKIQKDSVLQRTQIKDLSTKVHADVFICAVERGGEVSIPSGDFVLQEGDLISFIAPVREAGKFFKKIGMQPGKIKNVLVIGGGTLTYYLARKLSEWGISVKIIEKKLDRCEELSEILPSATIIHGDGTNQSFLYEEGLDNAAAVLSLTGIDEQNILISMNVRKKVPEAKVVTKLKQSDFGDIVKDLDIGSIVRPKYITADYIIQYVRAMQHSYGSNVETLHRIVGNKVEALEFRIRENLPFLGVPLARLKLRPGILIGCINRNGKIFTPKGSDVMKQGDTVIIITTVGNELGDLNEILL